MQMPDRLTAFLYLMMRDHVPTGTVKQTIEQIASDDELVLSAPELQQLAERYSAPLRVGLGASAGGEEEDERIVGEGEDGRVQTIELRDGDLTPLSSEGFTPEMVEWLDKFDDRIEGSPHFVQAVNEAAANEMIADDVSARIVAQRVQELTEQAARAAAAKRDEPEPSVEADPGEDERSG